VHSATKYLAGHNDTLAGALVARDAELVTRLRELAKTTGAVLAPFDAWLVTRGLKTLAVRLERQQASAARIAAWLAAHPAVGHVAYPGLPGFPGRDILEGQATGYGAMIAFTVRTPEAAQRVLRRVRLIQYAESLGGVESLITYPVAQTHADVPVAQREALGITDSLLRLSVGLEAPEDLLDDLAQALG
jgi:cystathionine beta-lyase/cystathionine gamma-synthase